MKVKVIIGLLSIVSLSFCTKNKTQIVHEDYFFSLKSYFEAEAQRLSHQQPILLKRVQRNATVEEKEIQIQDWEKEFGLFIESDINKISWKDSYQEIIRQDTLIYQSKDPKLRTQKILIVKDKQQIKEISIKNVVENYLYSSIEELKYYPDFLYEINKKQKVIILGSNMYYISGSFR